ncbi:DUF6134 family protein [Pelagibius marinus]|uniref:DUF6134 family protein n=1 Tax=Pelagibius marinus TaxID=2762760 RepID=UPI001873386E|nr:DUF6134 family protein [Pelagibius marinus]
MQRRQALKLLGGGGAALGLGPLGPFGGAAAACDLFPRQDGWRFLVLRHGNVIGEHLFTFSRRNGDFVVDIAIDIAVDLLGVTLFRFTHRAEEVWRDGWLHSLVSATDDDGTLWRLESEHRDGALRGKVNDVAFDVSGFVIPASLWHRDTPKTQALFGTIDGRIKVVRSEALGEEAVKVGADRVQARHYRLTGQLERDVWYGPDCGIAKVTFPARDGSLITLERQ